MFGLMRKLISKPFADTPEKRDQMDKLVCNMVDGVPMQPTETICLDSVTGPKTVKGHVCVGGDFFMAYPEKTTPKDEYDQTSVNSTSKHEAITGEVDCGDWPPKNEIDGLLIVRADKPVWRPHNGRDLPDDAIEVAFSNGETFKVDNGVYFIPSKRGWMRYRGGKYVGSVMHNVVAYHAGEYVRRIECRECWGGGKEVQTRTTAFSDYGWVGVSTKYTGAKCHYCKGKGYTLERFKR